MAENKTEEEILETDTVNEEASSAEEETKEAGNEASAGETEAKEAEEKADKKAEKKAAKQEKKAQKAMAQEEKRRKKLEQAGATPEEIQRAMEYGTEYEEEGGSRLAVFFVTFIIIVIWLAILTLLIKMDVGGFGSTVLQPLLKDVPYVNRILPETDGVETDSTESKGKPY